MYNLILLKIWSKIKIKMKKNDRNELRFRKIKQMKYLQKRKWEEK